VEISSNEKIPNPQLLYSLVAKWGHSPETASKLLSRSYRVRVPRCKQATASATPPIPPPIIASVGSFLYLHGGLAAGTKPDPEQFVQESRCLRTNRCCPIAIRFFKCSTAIW
jgi:hypothetical protein